MTSTFFGLETAKRGMNTQQNALFVTGQNISNANTLGYTRQRINFEATSPYPHGGMSRPQIPGQMGTGVKAGSIQRVRDSFLDQQYRGENSKLGYWSTRSDALSKMEDILNEPSDSGLSAAMNQFWQSLQDLSTGPENDGARAVVLQRGQAVAETFNYLSNSIKDNQQYIGNELDVSITDINSILKQIGEINQQISKVEPSGYLPNDLYDERDRLVDQLSNYFNVQVEPKSSGGNSSPIAEGVYDIKITDSNGNDYYLVKGSNYGNMGITGGTGSSGNFPPADGVTSLNITDADNNSQNVNFFDNGQVNIGQGKLRGLIESYGYKDNSGNSKGIYPEMLDQLDQLAYTFGTVFNQVHQKGYGKNGETGNDFFDLSSLSDYHGAAGAIKINSSLSKDMIAASTALKSPTESETGNGSNAINLGNVLSFDLSKGTITLEGFSTPTTITVSGSGTITSNYQAIIGKLGVDAQQANRLTANSQSLTQSVDQNRQSVSSVSLDEEMINMIKFQQAYNASARNITIVDEMLDKIINGLGTGGR
ncbi:flagellar biosynthesis protein FlgK [Heyndrickxia shackletonii]|uniref:Flagellar hook-associated protein 1 n=1 Tax=Heyndrickxia shackletonii TaxID=157838 RepID=A0A0Q3WW06_9BACI|nr:flagellar hook-associated protein FlgK [Heyndrickxia shackletonii]KQL52983.1 flagellar biosynthesis protein FlgK [Heyndrickxia shackletonii]NEY98531.1 flagellar hook-associated protein FlgK [Heyndrickxia shackletonii]